MGESIVDRYIKDHGFIPYYAGSNGSHPFDRICVTPNRRQIFIAEVKTKARRTYYEDTGINLRNYEEYEYIMKTYNLGFFIFFVDESINLIYGNYLTKLTEPYNSIQHAKQISYPWVDKGIIYFPLFKMNTICKLTPEEGLSLQRFSTRNYPYHSDLKKR